MSSTSSLERFHLVPETAIGLNLELASCEKLIVHVHDHGHVVASVAAVDAVIDSDCTRM